MRITAVWALVLLCYSNSFHAGMVADDVPAIQEDARVHVASGENIRLAFTDEYWYHSKTTGLYRPLTTLSYLFNYAVLGGGTNPVGYHAINLAIHLANIALLYLLGMRLFADTLPALALAALWGVHPVLTEAVTNIVGRADLLAAFGVLAGLLCHIGATGSAGRRRLFWLARLAAASAIAIFSKEAGVVLPAAMLLYDLAFRRGVEWKKRLAGYAAVAVPFAMFFALRARMLQTHAASIIPFVDNPLAGIDFWMARRTALTLILSDLRLILWPATLSNDYSYHQIPFAGWESPRFLAATLVCALALAAAILLFRRHRPEFFLATFFFVALAPVSNLVIVIGATMAERFLYLPAIAVIGCLVAALAAMRRPRILAAVIATLCLTAGFRTYARNPDWNSKLTLGRSSVAATPEAFRPHFALISAMLQAGDLDGAVHQSDTLLRILAPLSDEQNSMRAYEMAGEAYRRKGDASPTDAEAWYRKAQAALVSAERFGALEREHLRQTNLEQGKQAVIQPWPTVYLELARTDLTLHQPQEAAAAILAGRGQRIEPAVDVELSNAYRALGDTNRAAVTLIEGLLIDSSHTTLAQRLAQLYRETAAGSCAIKGSAIDMECPMVHDQVCTATRNLIAWYRQSGAADRVAATQQSAVSLGCAPLP